MKNIVLIGMMGCGKTTVGTLLARRLGMTLADTDQLIEAREGRSIPEIFAREGEEHFRALESALARELAGQEGLVVACGGGLPLREEAISPLWESGVVFWLFRDPGELYDSLDTAQCPLAQAGRAAFLERYAQREPIYRRWAHYVIQGHDDPAVDADQIAGIYQEVCQK